MKKISTISRILLLVSAVMLLVSTFVPIWKIELDAPQYPEGLSLEIWANKIAGDVDIINGLNHYIGMKTLHTEDFVEFSLLPYIILSYALLFFIASVKGTRKLLNIAFAAFVIFGIIAMVDFWIWEYNYGHHLDPNAAIKVPGMAYQPPLIGFKQLLNFGAYSIPHTGGWLFVAAGLLTLIAVLKEAGMAGRFSKKIPAAATACVLLLFSSCNSDGPQAIRLNADGCDFCRMTISDGKFGAELITQKGRVYKFDDIHCMLQFKDDLVDTEVKNYYVHNYKNDNLLIDATTAFYVTDPELRSPMGGNTAAFNDESEASQFANGKNPIVKWTGINHHKQKDHGGHPH